MAGQTVANQVVVQLGPSATVCVVGDAVTEVLVDVMGWFGADESVAGMNLTPARPERLVDTRTGLGSEKRPLAAGETYRLLVRLPVSVLNITAVQAQGDGFLTVHPCGFDRPLSSNLNVRRGGTVANQVYANANGYNICIYTSVATHLLVDLQANYG